MSESLEFPENAIWFIRAAQPGFSSSEGSAIAVRLRRQNDSGPLQNYLLTCAHVVRKPSGESGGFGPVYTEIKAWPPGSGFNPANGLVVSPVVDVCPTESGAAETFYQQAVADVPNADWVLLAFQKTSQANAQDLATVQNWIASPPTRGDICITRGYPGGSSAFQGHDKANNDIVTPSVPYAEQRVAAAKNGIVTFQGTETRAGMSGGAVFSKNGKEELFVGLHRERNDPTLQLHAVSAVQIKDILNKHFHFGDAFSNKSSGTSQPWIGLAMEDAVMLFPDGPNVREQIPFQLIRAIADHVPYALGKSLISAANTVRVAKDPGEERAKQVQNGRLPEPSMGMEPFVAAALDQARLKGPRTTAALLLMLCDDAPEYVKTMRDTVLSTFIDYH